MQETRFALKLCRKDEALASSSGLLRASQVVLWGYGEVRLHRALSSALDRNRWTCGISRYSKMTH